MIEKHVSESERMTTSTIQNIMTREVVSVKPDMPLQEAAERVLARKQVTRSTIGAA